MCVCVALESIDLQVGLNHAVNTTLTYIQQTSSVAGCCVH